MTNLLVEQADLGDFVCKRRVVWLVLCGAYDYACFFTTTEAFVRWPSPSRAFIIHYNALGERAFGTFDRIHGSIVEAEASVAIAHAWVIPIWPDCLQEW